MIRFFVPGRAAPGGSKTAFVRNGRAILRDAGKNNAEWKATVARAGAEAYAGPLLASALEVEMTFYRLRPASHFGTGKKAAVLKPSAPLFPTSKPDALKLARAAEDALTGVIWRDDASTVDLTTRKRWGPRPGVEITIRVKGDG